MSRFFTLVTYCVKLGIYWAADYWYVGIGQLKGLYRKGSSEQYIHKTGQRDLPVLLIPGIYEHWTLMKPIAKVLFAAGYDVHMIETIGYNRGSIEDMAQKIHEYCEAYALADCLIVAHSKGGLIGKYLMMHETKTRFAGMVALNTPFNGSKYAYLFLQKSIRVFTPSSKVLSALSLNEQVNTRIVSIYSIFDPHIPTGSFLNGAKNIQLKTYGHFRIISNIVAQKAIIESIERLEK